MSKWKFSQYVSELSGFVNLLAVCQVPGTDEVRNLKIEDVIMWCLVMAIARLRGR